eukprot:jgi/Mesvir1/20944/Mv08015-RA.1
MIVLKGGFKPASSEPPSTVARGATPGARQSSPDTKLPDDVSDDDSGGMAIPDEEMIRRARAKREAMRAAGLSTAPDYMPLSGGTPMVIGKQAALYGDKSLRGSGGGGGGDAGQDGLSRPGGSSSEEDEDDRRRVVFGGDLKPGKNSRHKGGSDKGGRGVLSTLGDTLDDPSAAKLQGAPGAPDEEEAWELQQLKKVFGAGGRGAGAGADRLQQGGGAVARNMVAAAAAGAGAGMPAVTAASWNRVASARDMTAAVDVEAGQAAWRALKAGLARMEESHEKVHASLAKTEASLAASRDNLASMQAALASTSAKYTFLQELRVYVAELCDCLKEKAPILEELEDHMLRIHEERARALAERRRADDEDELAEAEAAMNAACLAEERGATGDAMLAAVATAVANAIEGSSGGPPELDEFGRDVNFARTAERKKRRAARERRLAAREARRDGGEGGKGRGDADGGAVEGTKAEGDRGGGGQEGGEESEESEGEVEAFESARKEVITTAGDVFRDTAEEFCSLPHIKKRLEGLKRRYPATYRDGYVSLSIPQLFAPFVRIELLRWSPLYDVALEDRIELDQMSWYRTLFDYGMPEGGEFAADDADQNLVPQLIEKLVMPIVHHSVAHCWDPSIWRQSRRVMGAVQEMLIYVPADSNSMMDLVKAVGERLTAAINALVLPAWRWRVLPFGAAPQAAQLALRRFNQGVQLLRCLAACEGVLSQSLLKELALTGLVERKMVPHLKAMSPNPVDTLPRLERLVAAVPPAWLQDGQLVAREGLLDVARKLQRRLEARQGAGGAMADATQDMARRLVKVVARLGDYDHARDISRAFGIKEAI